MWYSSRDKTCNKEKIYNSDETYCVYLFIWEGRAYGGRMEISEIFVGIDENVFVDAFKMRQAWVHDYLNNWRIANKNFLSKISKNTSGEYKTFKK